MEEASICTTFYWDERKEQVVNPQHHFLWTQQCEDRTRSSSSQCKAHGSGTWNQCLSWCISIAPTWKPSSKEAFLEAIAVWVTIYCVFLPTFISEEPKTDNNTLCHHQKPWWRAADWHLFSDAGGKDNLHQRNNWWWHLLSCNGRASLFGSICTWKNHKPALCKYFHFPD